MIAPQLAEISITNSSTHTELKLGLKSYSITLFLNKCNSHWTNLPLTIDSVSDAVSKNYLFLLHDINFHHSRRLIISLFQSLYLF